MTEKSIKKIRSSLLDRSLSLSKLAVQSSAQLAVTGIKGAFKNSEGKELLKSTLWNAQAKLLTHELGRLKGSLMKVGQMLALYGEHFLPEEVVAQLKVLNDQSPAVDWSEIERLLKQRLTPEQLAQLDIDNRPLAAASMGQVHRATIRATGEALALKIQYPGVDAAVDTDVKALRSILGLLKLLPTQSRAFDELFDEIRGMLHQELDYVKELAFTDEARRILSEDTRFVVPRTFPQFSGPQLLATSFEEGVPLDSPLVLGLSEDRRTALGIAFVELFLDELFVFRMMQTDPHFGNYRVRVKENDDQIVLLDWGAVRRFEPQFLASYRKMIDGGLAMNQSLTLEAAYEIGFLPRDAGEKTKSAFCEIAFMAIEPWLPPQDPRVPSHLVDRNGHYIWSKSDLPTRITQQAARYALSFKAHPPPREVLFLDRKIGGIFIKMKVLDARFAGHKVLKAFLQKLDNASTPSAD